MPRSAKKHPLLRGANKLLTEAGLQHIETSPPTRGKLLRCFRPYKSTRNIPSYEGQTIIITVKPPYTPKHPLLRGANFAAFSSLSSISETSPPTRGKQMLYFVQQPYVRNIPSYEGQTVTPRRCYEHNSKHPLLRGANIIEAMRTAWKPETSPPTRGKLISLVQLLQVHRNIPSYEGQTLSVYAAFSRLKHLVVQFAQI